jgi:hypothetical protein
MNVASSHEISHANCLNLDAYKDGGHDPWQKDHNLLVDVCSLSEYPKVVGNFLKNASKLFKSDDYRSSNDTNQVSVVHDNRVLMNPT